MQIFEFFFIFLILKDDLWSEMSRQKMKMSPVDFINADCQGYLLKLDGRSKCWKTRFCLLSDAFLYLYVDKESESALGNFIILMFLLYINYIVLQCLADKLPICQI